MTKENVCLVPAQRDFLNKKIFAAHSVQDTTNDFNDLFFDYLSSDSAEDNEHRNRMLVSYGCIMKALAFLSLNENSNELELNINIQF